MDGATLRMLDSIRLAAGPGEIPCTASLEAFACLIYGRPPSLLDQGERDWIDRVVRNALSVASITGHTADSRALAFHQAYREVLHRGVDVGRFVPDPLGGALALERLLTLSPLQRAIVALSCVAEFTEAEVARVLSVSVAHVRRELEEGIASVRRTTAPAARAPEADGERRSPSEPDRERAA